MPVGTQGMHPWQRQGERKGNVSRSTVMAEAAPPEEREVLSAIQELEEHAAVSQQRQLRAMIAEAERRGDFTELALLTQRKLDLDRALRGLHQGPTLER